MVPKKELMSLVDEKQTEKGEKIVRGRAEIKGNLNSEEASHLLICRFLSVGLVWYKSIHQSLIGKSIIVGVWFSLAPLCA